MPKYTNTTRQALDFVTGGKPDAPEYTSFRAGETKDADLNVEHAAVAAALKTGALVAADAPAARRAAKVDALPSS